MRLGAYSAVLAKGSKVAEIYGRCEIEERHRHRYEVDNKYRAQLEEQGLMFSGMSPDGRLPEIVEWQDHPWFIGVQFSPRAEVQTVCAASVVRRFCAGGQRGFAAGLR